MAPKQRQIYFQGSDPLAQLYNPFLAQDFPPPFRGVAVYNYLEIESVPVFQQFFADSPGRGQRRRISTECLFENFGKQRLFERLQPA